MHMIHRPALVAALVFMLVCVGCSSGSVTNNTTLVLATILPMTGEAAGIGLAMQQGVDLAVKQNGDLGHGYTLTVAHADEASDPTAIIQALNGNAQVMGIVGPYDSVTAKTIIPLVTTDQLATISPTNTLPGLTKADQATAEGITYATLHPTGKPVAYFRLPEDDNAMAKVAADLAVTKTGPGSLAAQSAYVVDDGTDSGKAQAAAFTQEFHAKKGTVAGHSTLTTGATATIESVIRAIIEAEPDMVYYAGGTTDGGAELRDTLTLSGAPQLPILTGSQVADDPNWATANGLAAAAAATEALVSAPEPSTLTTPAAKSLSTAYQAAYPNTALLPQTVMAYDAAMVAITAIKTVVASGKTPSRAAVVAAVAKTAYAGVMGAIAFDPSGDNTLALGFSLYTCDTKGKWNYTTHLNG